MYFSKRERKLVEEIVSQYKEFAVGIDQNLIFINEQLLRNMLKVITRTKMTEQDLVYVFDFLYNTNGIGRKLVNKFEKECYNKEQDYCLKSENGNIIDYFCQFYFDREEDYLFKTTSLILFFEKLSDEKGNNCLIEELCSDIDKIEN